MAESKVSEGSAHVRRAADLQLLRGRALDIAVALCGIGGTGKTEMTEMKPATLVIVIATEHFLWAKTTTLTPVNMPCLRT